MKKIIYLLSIVVVMLANKVYGAKFTDIENHWAKDEIEKGVENLIINGYEDKTFKPNNYVSVAEYLKILTSSANFDLIRDGFTVWPYAYISTGKATGLILDSEFDDYNKKLTRNEIARITARYIDVEDVEISKNKLMDLDANYEIEIQKLVELNVINGYEDRTFRGENLVTRAEAIVIANRATNIRRELISNRTYTLEEKKSLTNINENFGIRYEIIEDEIYAYDSGRYSKLEGYKVQEDNINVKKVINVIDKMIDEDSYTKVMFVPSELIPNQLIIYRGENEKLIDDSGYDFSFLYYENGPYELKRISKEDIFSEECYLKIELGKMWRYLSELNQKKYTDKYKKEKLRRCLEVEFGTKYADEILEYMIEKYELKISRESYGERQVEQKIFGKYIVNYYKTTDGNPRFFIAIDD